jgi:ectoine hydroxylase-related dioxygenase (phytanoyl-CoA dioxygenase family)
MRHVFIDNDLAIEFNTKGYAVLKSSILKQIVSELNQLYSTNFTADYNGMLVSHQNDDYTKNKKISASIYEILTPLLSTFFKEYDTVVSHFICKKAMHPEYFKLHKDWSYVNEKEAIPTQFWIPMCPVSQHNGGFFLLPGTHLTKTTRSFSFGIDVLENTHEILNDVVSIQLKEDEFLIYHPAIYHGSYPNLSENNRICALGALIPKNEKLIYSQKIEKEGSYTKRNYLVDATFYFGNHFKCVENEDEVLTQYTIENE